MLAKNLVHQAILAGHSARFITAADLILDLTAPRNRPRAPATGSAAISARSCSRIDEVGYLAYDAHAADLLFQVVSRRYEQKSIVITTNLPFKQWDTVFPNAACAVALIDRLTHHAEIITIEGRVLSQARGRAGPEAEAGAEAEAVITPSRPRRRRSRFTRFYMSGDNPDVKPVRKPGTKGERTRFIIAGDKG